MMHTKQRKEWVSKELIYLSVYWQILAISKTGSFPPLPHQPGYQVWSMRRTIVKINLVIQLKHKKPKNKHSLCCILFVLEICDGKYVISEQKAFNQVKNGNHKI